MGWLGNAWVARGVFARLFADSVSSAVLAESGPGKDVFNLCHINHGHRALVFLRVRTVRYQGSPQSHALGGAGCICETEGKMSPQAPRFA